MDLFGGAKNTTKSKKTKKTSDTKKTTKASDAKKPKKSTTTRSKSKTKGGNFLGAIGDLVAPTGWGPFATAAGLLALDRADAALRRGTKEKKEKMKGGKCDDGESGQIKQVTIGPIGHDGIPTGNILSYYNTTNKNKMTNYTNTRNLYNYWPDITQNIVIQCNDQGKYYYKVNIICDGEVKTYIHTPPKNKKNQSNNSIYYYDTFEEAKKNALDPKTQIFLVKLALLNLCKKATKS